MTDTTTVEEPEDNQSTESDGEVTRAAEAIVAALGGSQPTLAEPEDDELGDDLVFVRNGWIRVTIAGTMYKLRRPFLGELRDLELSRETDQEAAIGLNSELHALTSESMKRATEIEAQAKDLNDSDPVKRALDLEATKLGFEATVASNKVIRASRDLRAKWWEQVFKVLTPPGHEPPEQMPSWVTDPNLQQRAIQHWQASPLGRGG